DLGNAVGNAASAALVPQAARVNPTAPPTKASNMLSMSDCRSNRDRAAPNAVRIANSRALPVDRASIRLLTLTHAISNTNPTAPSSIHKVVSMSPTRDVFSPTNLALLFLLVSG